MIKKGRYYKYSTNDGMIFNYTSYPAILLILKEYNFFKITTKDHLRLDLLAKKYFNDSKLWWIIAMVNDIPGDSIRVPAGTELYIPRNYIRYAF